MTTRRTQPLTKECHVTRFSIAAMLLVTSVVAGCDVNSALERLSDARRLSANLQVDFTKATDASNKAVMAETDEASIAFAKEATKARDDVQHVVDTLGPILQELRYTDEARLLDHFRQDFATYCELDQRVLTLVVSSLPRRNTDVRSLALSMTEKGQAVTTCEGSLRALQDALSKRGFTGTR